MTGIPEITPPHEIAETPEQTALATITSEAARVNQIFQWILSGATEHDIAEAVQTAWPECDPQPLILLAVARLRESASIDADTVIGWCFEATRDMYRRMVEVGDFPGALRAVKQMRDLAAKHGTLQQDRKATT